MSRRKMETFFSPEREAKDSVLTVAGHAERKAGLRLRMEEKIP